MKQFRFNKKDGLLDIQGITLLMSYLQAARNGEYTITISQEHPKRTTKQNAWLWGLIYPVMRQALVSKGWEFTDDQQVHDYFISRIAKQNVINRDTGEVIEFPDSTSEMDTVQFSAYCGELMKIGTEYLGVDISSLLPKEFRSGVEHD